MADPFAPRSMKRKNVKGLALTPAAPKPPPTAETANNRSMDESAQLEIGIEYNLDLRPDDLEFVKELGSGNGGTVSKMRHIVTNTTMARKVMHVEAKREMRKRIVRELQIMRGCHSEYIVTFYGSFLNDNNDVIMCMEYMDVGSLDRVSRVFGPVRVDVLGKIAEATLGGLTYLYVKHHIMHRDIKPSNILVNSRGNIKLCDFGVSGELINSIADTFVGTSTYMAPERIQGERYTVKSDVWSFGLTIMELAIGKFPFAASEQLSDAESAPAGILDLLQQIVHEPAPRLPKSDAFPSILEDMIQKCLYKNPDERPTPQELFERDPFVQAAKRTPVDLREWAVGMMERDNRKSHLAPQLSPATQELLRSSDSPTFNAEERTIPTPTSGEIPIVGDNILSPRDQQSTSAASSSAAVAASAMAPVATMSSNYANRSPTRGNVSVGLGSATISSNISNLNLNGGGSNSASSQSHNHNHSSSSSSNNNNSSSSSNSNSHSHNGSASAGLSLGYGGSLGRNGGAPVHPGMGARMATTDSVPRVPPPIVTANLGGSGAGLGSLSGGPGSANAAVSAGGGTGTTTFSLPVRPAPPHSSALPPLPPKKETADEYRRRQQVQQQVQQQQQQQQQQYHQQYQQYQQPQHYQSPQPYQQSQQYQQQQPYQQQQSYQQQQQHQQAYYPPTGEAYPVSYPTK